MSNVALDRSDDGSAPWQRHRLRTFARRAALGLLIAVALFVIAVVVTARWGDKNLWPPAPGTSTAAVFVANHGYHAGIILPRQVLAETAGRRQLVALGQLAARFANFEWLEIGWGEERFYRNVPTIDALTVRLAARALLHPGNSSVLHVVGFNGNPPAVFVHSDLMRLDLGMNGFERLAARLDGSFAHNSDGRLPQALGPGLYGTSLFFRANGNFHIFNVCNHWTAGLLDAAGVPTAPVVATFPAGLLLDLEWRSGLARSSRP
jgi:uncharacterized protein (TIGR02117 family)